MSQNNYTLLDLSPPFLADEYGDSDVWLEVKVKDKTILTVEASVILEHITSSLSYFEGLNATIISHFLIIVTSEAQGQGGGILIIDIFTKDIVFASKEIIPYDIEAIYFLEKYEIFLFAEAVSTYAWTNAGIFLINLDGQYCYKKVYGINNFKPDKIFEPSATSFLRNIEDAPSTWEAFN